MNSCTGHGLGKDPPVGDRRPSTLALQSADALHCIVVDPFTVITTVRVAMSFVHRTLVRRAAEILVVGSALVHYADLVRDYYMPSDEKARVDWDLASENRERFEILQERLAKVKALFESKGENGARAD